LTMGCAQCHDHKYDPISQRDYYRFFAYFNTLGDRGLDGDGGFDAVPKINITTVLASEQEIDAVRRKITKLEQTLHEARDGQPQWEEATRARLAQRGRDLVLNPMEVLKVTTPNSTNAFRIDADGTINVAGNHGNPASVSLKTAAPPKGSGRMTGLRIEFLIDRKFAEGRTGYGTKGNVPGSFIMTGFSCSSTGLPADQLDLYREVPIAEVTASASNPKYPPADCLDERYFNGWSPYPFDTKPQHITFTFAEPVDTATSPYVTLLMTFHGGGQGPMAGKFRVFAMYGSDDGTNVPADVQQLLGVAPSARSADQAERVRGYFAVSAPQFRFVRWQLSALKERLDSLTKPYDALVMDVSRSPRQTFVLNRGQYDQPTEKINEPGVPAVLPPLPANAPHNRLGLARWLVQPDHPLTARVAVNRLWQMLFGRGIVATPADFGSQGDPPTHPELLDYLATEFVRGGWNQKEMIRRLVTSATYRQSSRITPEALARDPENRLLARGPRFRLQAEFIRDMALQASGLLVDRIGGPSVFPYQPAGLWKEVSHFGSSPATSQVFVGDHGEGLYRRSMYTYWKRTVPPPTMFTFDAPNREICTARRATTNTPLQALVLLNDPQYVEASRVLAQRMLTEGPADARGKIAFAFELVNGRTPTSPETAILLGAYERELANYQRDRGQAEQILSVGESARDAALDSATHAAWTSVASLILNLSETITRG
ncbi:MAG: DUF1549 and DUF1553 domain-containing protein, partial [Planctomycetia bacterium]|nr:DUF1549 and DUF1553 domain-containing protein [Planctomycetia bacterium]